MELSVGDLVQYRSVRHQAAYTEHIVEDVYPEGIPSCREPMVKLKGKSGVVLASHCVRVYMDAPTPAAKEPRE